MAASARHKRFTKTLPQKQRGLVRLANGLDDSGLSPVHDQHLMLEAAFTAPEAKPYPAAVKAAIFLGAPTLLWAAIFMIGAQVVRAGA